MLVVASHDETVDLLGSRGLVRGKSTQAVICEIRLALSSRTSTDILTMLAVKTTVT